MVSVFDEAAPAFVAVSSRLQHSTRTVKSRALASGFSDPRLRFDGAQPCNPIGRTIFVSAVFDGATSHFLWITRVAAFFLWITRVAALSPGAGETHNEVCGQGA